MDAPGTSRHSSDATAASVWPRAVLSTSSTALPQQPPDGTDILARPVGGVLVGDGDGDDGQLRPSAVGEAIDVAAELLSADGFLQLAASYPERAAHAFLGGGIALLGLHGDHPPAVIKRIALELTMTSFRMRAKKHPIRAAEELLETVAIAASEEGIIESAPKIRSSRPLLLDVGVIQAVRIKLPPEAVPGRSVVVPGLPGSYVRVVPECSSWPWMDVIVPPGTAAMIPALTDLAPGHLVLDPGVIQAVRIHLPVEAAVGRSVVIPGVPGKYEVLTRGDVVILPETATMVPALTALAPGRQQPKKGVRVLLRRGNDSGKDSSQNEVADPDCVLDVGNDALSHVLRYLPPVDLLNVQICCNTLHRSAEPGIAGLISKMNKECDRVSEGEDSRTKLVRYVNAMALAEQVRNGLSDHLPAENSRNGQESPKCPGGSCCSFPAPMAPDELLIQNQGPRLNTSKYEFFFYFYGEGRARPMFRGFLPKTSEDIDADYFSLSDVDGFDGEKSSEWKALKEFLSTSLEDFEFSVNVDPDAPVPPELVESYAKFAAVASTKLSIIVIAVNKKDGSASFVGAGRDFDCGGDDEERVWSTAKLIVPRQFADIDFDSRDITKRELSIGFYPSIWS